MNFKEMLGAIKGGTGSYLAGAMALGTRGGAATYRGIYNQASNIIANPWARRGTIGAAAGGLYGAMSDDTSVLGGAAAGFAGARYLAPAVRRMGKIAFNPRSHGISLMGTAGMHGQASLFGAMKRSARASYEVARMDAIRSKSFIGNTLTAGYGKIRGLF